jgi:hypothetical protein
VKSDDEHASMGERTKVGGMIALQGWGGGAVC